MNITCKTCKRDLQIVDFSRIKRKNGDTYRQTCKSCEYAKAQRRKANKLQDADVTKKIEDGTDPAFFIDDPEAKMPSDSDLLFWSTPFYDDIIDGRKVLMNKVPKDD
jgi:hypothetical protein